MDTRTNVPSLNAPLLPSQEVGQRAQAVGPDVEDPAVPRREYTECLQLWDLCGVMKEGTPLLQANAERYLPRFDSEDQRDYQVRVAMTFLDNHYEQATTDLVGLAFAEPPTLKGDVDEMLRAFLENVDGEGTAWDVFLEDTLEAAMDWGHAAIYTDYPQVEPGEASLKDLRDGKVRPYWMRYRAIDIPRWRTTVIGGVRVLTMVTLREPIEKKSGEHGTKAMFQYREVSQEVIVDASGMPKALGRITFVVKVCDDEAKAPGERKWTEVQKGVIKGPKTIPLRIVYGGRKLGILHSRPHLIGLAMTNWEEVQVKSDYSAVMHKCNVPTPYFVNRTKTVTVGGQDEGKMGSGIDLGQGGSAGFLEPQGTALDATRTRIEDIRLQMRRQGAALNASDGKLTATEAEIFARQRNARLRRAVKSLNDQANAALGDMAEFAGLDREKGGSIAMSTNFAGSAYDPQFVSLVAEAYDKGALPLDVYLYAIQKGKLPDEFSAEEVALKMLSAALADRARREPPEGAGAGEGDGDDAEKARGRKAGVGVASKPIDGEGEAAGALTKGGQGAAE